MFPNLAYLKIGIFFIIVLIIGYIINTRINNSIIYSINFDSSDYKEHWLNMNLITKENKNFNNNVCKLGSNIQYSISFEKKITQIEKYKEIKKIKVKSRLFFPTNNTKLILVFSVHSKNKQLIWESQNINEYLYRYKPNEWNKIELYFNFPCDYPEDSKMKIYFWNNEKNNVLIDDLSIELIK